MFMVMNPPLKARKRTRSNAGKSRLAKLLAKFRARSAKRSKSFRSLALNRGGSRRPLTCRLSSAPYRGVMTMRRRHRRNAGTVASVKNSVLSGLKPKVWWDVAPYAGGAVVSELVTMFVSKFIPYTKSGLGNIALGLASSGITGTLSGALLKKKDVGQKMFIGGVAAVVGKVLNNVRSQGVSAFGLRDFDLGYDINPGGSFPGFQGMNDFVSPPQIGNAIQSAGSIAQYSLPNANAQYVPQVPQMQMPTGMRPSGVSGAEEASAVGAMMDDQVGY